MYMKRMTELVGKTINYWTILEARPKGLKSMVLARCICGKEVITRGRSIKSQVSKSCGCRRKEYARKGPRLKDGNSAFNRCYSHYRTKAVNHNLDFTLSQEQFKILTKGNCFYCEKPPSNLYKSKTQEYQYNGIDRINNFKGYTIENSVSCCADCNTKKGGITPEMVLKLYGKLFKA